MDTAKLKAELILQGKTVSWLAKQLGYSTANMYSKISGRTSTTIDDAKKIISALNLNGEKANDFNPRAREGRDRKIATFCAVKLNVCVNYSIKKNKKRS